MNLPKGNSAIVVVSFGTSHDDTRAKTIDAIEKDFAAAYPQYQHFSAWTSRIIAKKTGHPMLADVMKQMATLGIRNVFLQPTHIMKAIEFESIKADIEPYRAFFNSITLGKPLLSGPADIQWMAQFLMTDYAEDVALSPDEILVFMGHGTDHPENAVYRQLQDALIAKGCKNILIGTVEGSPNFQDLLNSLDSIKPQGRNLCLAPLMIVAGDHAKNDLMGDDDDSWNSMLSAKGYQVRGHLKGLGEYSKIRMKLLGTGK